MCLRIHPTRPEGPVAASWGASRGFTVIELVLVIAIAAIVLAIAAPQFLSYYGSATSTAGVQEMRSALYRAKQLAITIRQNICVVVIPGPTPAYQFRQGDCAGVPWVGPGTDGAGNLTLQNGVGLSNGAGNPIFTPLATVSQGGTLTVTGQNGVTRTVTVTPAGRITVP